MADKLGVEFALIHRKRDGKSQNAPERMELLVGDVRDKEQTISYTLREFLLTITPGGYFGGRHDRYWTHAHACCSDAA